MSLYSEVVAATSQVQADLRAQGCGVEIIAVEDGEVFIRLIAAAGT